MSDSKYVIARTCGHRTYYTTTNLAGIEWCPMCRAYVGVIVTHIDSLRTAGSAGLPKDAA
jgi:hypothetical protein